MTCSKAEFHVDRKMYALNISKSVIIISNSISDICLALGKRPTSRGGHK